MEQPLHYPVPVPVLVGFKKVESLIVSVTADSFEKVISHSGLILRPNRV